MKLLLVFPPPSSPTYVPLGISTLVSWIGTSASEVDIDVCDLNISLWERFIHGNPKALSAAEFMRTADVYSDQSHYLRMVGIINKVSDRVHQAVEQTKTWLEDGLISPELDSLLDEMCLQLLSGKPDVIGFSVMFPLQLYFSLELGRRIKEKSGTKVILGGASISAFDRKELLRVCSWIDVLIAGEGEKSLLEWLKGAELASIGGLVWRNQDKVIANPKPMTTTLNDLPEPDFSKFSFNRYLLPEPVLSVVFSRGCLWKKCRFCAHNFPFSGYRTKRYQQIVKELQVLKERYNCRHFYFADQYITPEDALRLADSIDAAGLDIRYHVMGRPVAGYTLDLLERMHRSGCRWISWGIESGSDRLLNLSNKGTVVSEIEEVLQNAYQVGISNLAMIIFGLPTTTDEDLQETFRFFGHVWPWVNAFTASRFQLFDHTGFASTPDKYDLKVTGREIVLNLKGKLVHSNRLYYKRRSDISDSQTFRAVDEIERWKKYREWYGFDSFFERLVNEHYLLFASQDSGSFINKTISLSN